MAFVEESLVGFCRNQIRDHIPQIQGTHAFAWGFVCCACAPETERGTQLLASH